MSDINDNNHEQEPKCGSCCKKGEPRGKLYCTNWLSDVPGGYNDDDMVEVQFKNTRKGFFINSTKIPLEIGDMVAVESNPGHDIGEVTMVGKLVRMQMKKANLRPDFEVRRIFRKAKPSDIERYEEAKSREIDTMIRSRKIADDLKLNMKIGDVEYQGDGNKAIFYYIADERVDFRQLIKLLADAFKVRIEMKQIGARQEAGRIGGIGPCGRPLCCSTWMTSFKSVATSAARYQDISLNPQKLAGQCAKLKCCLNYEVDAYVESQKKLPSREIQLYTKNNTYYHFKTDIFSQKMTYSTDKHIPANLVTINSDRVFEVIAMNKKGQNPERLEPESSEKRIERKEFEDVVGQDSLTRFDKSKKRKKRNDQRPRPQNANSNTDNQDNPNTKKDRGDRPERQERGDRPDRINNRNRERRNNDRSQSNRQNQPKNPTEGNEDNNASNNGNNGNNRQRTFKPRRQENKDDGQIRPDFNKKDRNDNPET